MDLEKYESDKEAFMVELEQLRPDLLFPESWGKAEKTKAADMIRSSKIKVGMLKNIPMLCRGPQCQYAAVCPLLAENLAPVGDRCPIEMAMVVQFFADYVDELGVDTSRMVEVSIVRDLVDQEIQQMRKTNILAQDHFIVENPVGVDSDGNVVLRKELHQAVEFEDKIQRRKEKLRSQLLATREAQAKAGQGTIDNARAMANLLDQYRDLSRERDRLLLEQMGKGQYDAYIEDADIVEGDDGEA